MASSALAPENRSSNPVKRRGEWFGNSAKSVTALAVKFSTSGDQTIIPAQGGRTIRVYQFLLSAASATNVTIKDGVAGPPQVSLSGPMALITGTSLPFHGVSMPFVTQPGNPFVINSSAAVQVSGTVWWEHGA